MPTTYPTYKNIGFTPSPLTLEKPNMQYRLAAIQQYNDTKDKIVDSKATIQATLNSLPVHESEQGWLSNYADAIQEKINQYIRLGDYDSALYSARTLAKTSLTDPAVTSRVKRNTQYEAEKAAVLNDKTLSPITKQRWEEQNQYSTGLVTDDYGRVNDWSSSWKPVAPVNLEEIYEEVKKLVAPQKGSSESAMFLDENGNLTNDISKGFYGVAVQKGTAWEKVSEDRLKNAFDALFRSHPEYMEAIMQDMDDRRWQYEKANDADKEAFLGSDIMDANGEFYSPQEYLDRRVNPVLHEMAVNNRHTSASYGNAFANKLADDRAKAAAAAKAAKDTADKQALANLMGLNSTVAGPNIEIPLGEQAASSYSILKENVSNIAKMAPEYYASARFKELLAKGDYNTIADEFVESINSKYGTNETATATPAVRQELGNANVVARLLRSEGEIFNRLTDGLDKATVDAITFSSAIDSNMPLPTDNRYSRNYTNAKNQLFSYRDGNTTETGEAIGITFQDQNQRAKVIDYLKAAGIGQELFGQYGLKWDKDKNGKIELRVAKDSPALADVATAMAQNPDRFWSFDRSNVSVYRTFDSNIPRELVTQTADNWGIVNRRPTDILKELSKDGDLVAGARTIATDAYSINPNANMVVPLQVLPYDDYNTMSLTDMWMNSTNDFLNTTNYKEVKSHLEANNMKAFAANLANANNNAWYGDPEGTGTARQLTQEEVGSYIDEIQAALAQNRVEFSPGDAPTRNRFGTLIRIAPKQNAKGETINDYRYFYVDGLLRNEAALAYANNPDVLAKADFKRYRAMGVAVEDLDGNPIDYNSETAFDDFKLARKMDEAYRSINTRKGTLNEITDNELQLYSLALARQYRFGTSDPQEMVDKVKDRYNVTDAEAVNIIQNMQVQDNAFAALYQTILGKLYNVSK